MDPGLSVFARIRAYMERLIFQGADECGRCRRPWTVIRGHSTDLGDGRGCVALCESCWEMLNPQERLPYYKRLWCYWVNNGWDTEPWDVMRVACLHERRTLQVESEDDARARIRLQPVRWREYLID